MNHDFAVADVYGMVVPAAQFPIFRLSSTKKNVIINICYRVLMYLYTIIILKLLYSIRLINHMDRNLSRILILLSII